MVWQGIVGMGRTHLKIDGGLKDEANGGVGCLERDNLK